ncbi:MAG: hypothetical protein KA313_04665, partial [Pseudarcicella sp.]|nr:hypothetical protein [Pseudarcicella sp.]
YSFDKSDVQEYGFKEIYNYNYLPQKAIKNRAECQQDLLYIASFDERLKLVFGLKQIFKPLKIKQKWVIVGKKTFFYRLRNLFSNKIKDLDFSTKRIEEKELHTLYDTSFAILDLVRKNQTGISFRVFEAMAFQKKIITNNASIKEYNFYNPNNICVINSNNPSVNKNFFESNYQALPPEIYQQYTIENWVEKVFLAD